MNSTEIRRAVFQAFDERKRDKFAWTPDAEIARRYGLTSERMSQMRRQWERNPDAAGLASVYFVRAGNRFVKIGWTKDAVDRLSKLQSACPLTLTLLVAVPGSKGDETSLHNAFAAHRERGEWFRLVEPIRQYIKAAKAAGRLLSVEEVNAQDLE